MRVSDATMIYYAIQLEKKLRDLKCARSEEELMARLKDCAFEISNVIQLAKSRENVCVHVQYDSI